MSTLGLSGPPEPSEGLWRGLFWPSVKNACDADLVASRGFWLCLIVGLFSLVQLSYTSPLTAIGVGCFFLVGATGVRQGSLAAAVLVFSLYLVDTIAFCWFSPFHFSFLRFVGLAILLTNLRATVLSHRWRSQLEPGEDTLGLPTRMNETWRDKLVDQVPPRVWPWGRAIFYLLASLLLPLEIFGIWFAAKHGLPLGR